MEGVKRERERKGLHYSVNVPRCVLSWDPKEKLIKTKLCAEGLVGGCTAREQFRDTCDRTIQVKWASLTPNFPPAKGHTRDRDICPARNSHNGQVWLMERQQLQRHPQCQSREPAGAAGRAGAPHSLAMSRCEKIKSGPLSSAGVEKCRETPWKSSRIWND